MNARIGVLALVPLLVTACAAGSHEKAAGGSAQTNHDQAVKYAKCMRSHGDPSWPDPGPGGAFPNENGSLDRSSAAYKTAQAACKKLEPNGAPDQTLLQKDYQRLLKFSTCMRSHGMPDFPNPTLDKSGVGIEGKIDVNSPQYKTAHAACRTLEPGPGNP